MWLSCLQTHLGTEISSQLPCLPESDITSKIIMSWQLCDWFQAASAALLAAGLIVAECSILDNGLARSGGFLNTSLKYLMKYQ